MTVATVLNIALWVFTIMGYIIYNLYQRSNKLEKMVEESTLHLNETKLAIRLITAQFEEVDNQQIFRANDHIGSMFNDLKLLNEQLKLYR